MIVHDKNLLHNSALITEAENLENGGFISKEQKKIIKKTLPAFTSQSNILVRIGFFLLGSFLYSSICSLISLIALSVHDYFLKICCFIFAGIGVAGAEFLAKQKIYRHGLDDAFILGILLNVGVGVFVFTEDFETIITPAIFVALTSFLTYKRYLHLLSMLVFCFAVSAVLFFGMFEIGDIGKSILPFAAMLASGGFYFFTKQRIKNLKESYYYNGLLLANSFCLILFYVSCNYLVVRELSSELLGVDVLPGKDIPFSYFFYAFTFIVPIVYLVQALKTKDRIMLWISFAAIAFTIFTIRFYYSVLPIEAGLTIGGLIMFGIAYFSIQNLKNKESGMTFKPDRINHSNAILNAETLIVASALGVKPEVKTGSPIEFEGGDFSGGGSGGSF
ncbi:hypothetical protein ASE21_10815 [Flavobacterium sp. Root901]|uniref:hypothetical protein n=1 Tax=Flavobacterium sp. Root901 TaxID=1736605 RepID=UPI00070E8EB5|nr:hypothetical protein [Flavobacterium sp. Root901]KRD10204.1 hypothetical protein ASE21_10815 [Flavobacterium sp. Root901]